MNLKKELIVNYRHFINFIFNGLRTWFGQTLHLMQDSEIMLLDHSNETNIHQWNVLENTMEGLYRANHKGDPIPALATGVAKPTNHGKRYTFNLRKEAKRLNGDPVTAQDFVTSCHRSVSPSSRSGCEYIFTGVKKCDRYYCREDAG